MPRPSLQTPIAFLFLACGLLPSATIDHGIAISKVSATPLAPLQHPRFSVTSRRGHLLLQATTVSAAHEATLLQLVDDHFAHQVPRTEFTPGVILEDYWESASDRLLYALAATESSHAIMQDDSIEIQGVTNSPEIFQSRLEFVRENLPANLPVSTDIIEVDPATSFDELCKGAFSQLVFEPVSFRESSNEIRTASFVSLDRISDFAYDCQQTMIVITGHTDASGDESWNRRLSLARAQAVADYIAHCGIDPQRLLIKGLGSSQPIADNSTPLGRSLNRRIEIELQ